jgi:hypothetical protein
MMPGIQSACRKHLAVTSHCTTAILQERKPVVANFDTGMHRKHYDKVSKRIGGHKTRKWGIENIERVRGNYILWFLNRSSLSRREHSEHLRQQTSRIVTATVTRTERMLAFTINQ